MFDHALPQGVGGVRRLSAEAAVLPGVYLAAEDFIDAIVVEFQLLAQVVVDGRSERAEDAGRAGVVFRRFAGPIGVEARVARIEAPNREAAGAEQFFAETLLIYA